MKCNVEKTDKIIKVIMGLIVIAAGVFFKSWWGLVELLSILTAVVSWCPAYVPINISSCTRG